MRDDRVQGILFSRNPRADQAKLRRDERRVLADKLRMQGYLSSSRELSPLAPETGKPSVVVRGGKRRHADLYRLTKRFKDIEV